MVQMDQIIHYKTLFSEKKYEKKIETLAYNAMFQQERIEDRR